MTTIKDQDKLGKNCMLLSLKKFLGFGLVGGMGEVLVCGIFLQLSN